MICALCGRPATDPRTLLVRSGTATWTRTVCGDCTPYARRAWQSIGLTVREVPVEVAA